MTASAVESIRLTVDTAARGIRVVRVAGALDATTAPRLVRLLDLLLREVRAERPAAVSVGVVGHLIVDLAGVRCWGIGGLGALRHARYVGGQTGIGVHLTGLARRDRQLPLRVAGPLTQFSTFPTATDALTALAADARRAPGR